MLATSTITLFVLGTVLVLIMPGPTNTLLAAAGLRQGVRRSARLTAAELAGYLGSISLWGYLLAHTAHFVSWLPMFVRTASILYIAWLAVRMWREAVALPAAARVAVGMRTLFVATLLNPKALLFASTIFPAAAFAAPRVYLQIIALFSAMLVPIGLVWIAFGAALGSGRVQWLKPGHVQRGASVVLGMFSLLLAWSTFH
jgi:threonine/homoserine/homoserine lactone efflux protein